MPKPRLPYLNHEKTRFGVMFWYVRVGKGPRVRLRDPYGSPAFLAAYRDAIAGKAVSEPRKPGAGSLLWLWETYRASPAWRRLSPNTQKQREFVLRPILNTAGGFAADSITRKEIIAARDERAPVLARKMVFAMRGLFQWAVEAEHLKVDPTQGVKTPRAKTDGFHTWTAAEMAKFEAHWPIGTRERLAYDILAWTGLRRGDACRLGPQHVSGGLISIKTAKTGTVVEVEILPPLAESIAATPTGADAFVVTHYGKPRTKDAFGMWFLTACKAAGVPGRAHGLRKALSVQAAEGGATDKELDALMGWQGGGMSALYTRKASRKRLAKSAQRALTEKSPP